MAYLCIKQNSDIDYNIHAIQKEGMKRESQEEKGEPILENTIIYTGILGK